MGGDAEIRGSSAGVEGYADDRNHSSGINKVGDSGAYPDGPGADRDP